MPLNRAQRRRVRARLWRGAQAASPPEQKTSMEAVLRQCAEIQHTQFVNHASTIQNMQMQAVANAGDMEALSSTFAADLHDLAQTTATQAQVEEVLAGLKKVIQKQERTWGKVLALDAKMNALTVNLNNVRNEAFDPHRYLRRHS